MRFKNIVLMGLPVALLAWCVSGARWSTTSVEEVELSNGKKIEVTRRVHYRQVGEPPFGFAPGGVAREWSISFPEIESPSKTITWEAEDRVPMILDIDGKTGHLFLVSVKPFSNGLLGDHHWPNGNQNPYYIYELDGRAWKEVPFRADLMGRKNNLLVRFDLHYVNSPTPRNIGRVTREEKARVETEQETEIKADRYKYNLKYRIVGDH